MDNFEQNKKAAIESIETMADFYKEMANAIWEQPELSLKEFLGKIL